MEEGKAISFVFLTRPKGLCFSLADCLALSSVLVSDGRIAMKQLSTKV